MIDRLCIFGVGLIGGSLALALREAGYCKHIIGCSRDTSHLARAKQLGVIDEYTTDPARAVRNADIVFLAVPLGAMQTILEKIKDHLSSDTIITDGGSAKGCVQQAAIDVFGELPPRFIPGHPIAGREKSGVEAAVADLYQNRRVILTPTETTNNDALQTIREMWQATGAIVEHLGIEEHDQVLAATSHLPHILAYQLVSTLAHAEVTENIFKYAAGGFEDFTRIASSDPVMWRDICLQNKTAILSMLDKYEAELLTLKKHIEKMDGERILSTFEQAKAIRDQAMEDKRA